MNCKTACSLPCAVPACSKLEHTLMLQRAEIKAAANKLSGNAKHAAALEKARRAARHCCHSCVLPAPCLLLA